jgi:hypothetical protein
MACIWFALCAGEADCFTYDDYSNISVVFEYSKNDNLQIIPILTDTSM